MKLIDSRLTEFWFGMQAFGTGLLSILTSNPESAMSPMIGLTAAGQVSFFFICINVVFAIPQIIAAIKDHLFWRHWTNLTTSILSMTVSVSLVGQPDEHIAIYGYAFLSLATLHCAFLTNAKQHANDS